MRALLRSAALLLAFMACDVPIDDTRNDRRLFPPRGLLRGTVSYVGPRPCSRDGHIVGNAVVLVFDRRNPPPPYGFASSPANFVAVPGDVLFANEPRSVGPDLYCPDDGATVEVSTPFAVAPLDAGSYVVAAFYDRRGRFWPTFKFRNLPEAGDIGGGYIDAEDAARNAGNVGYVPIYRAVDVGTADDTGEFAIGPDGYVADNIPVTIGTLVPFTRPYFHPRYVDPTSHEEMSAEDIGEAVRSPANVTGDALAVPILAMTQDVHVLAPPTSATPQSIAAYQNGFQSLKLAWGVAKGEVAAATDPAQPFGFQLPMLPPQGQGGLVVFSRGISLPDNPAIPSLWPQVTLVKLADDPERRSDRQSLVVQGTPEETLVTGKPPGPLVVIQGITLLDDSLERTMNGSAPTSPSTAALRDHVTALIRPAAMCFTPGRMDLGAVLVTPHLRSQTADGKGEAAIFDPDAPVKAPVREFRRGCLPMGRYAITLAYPTGQSWTVPNESGGCSASEGNVVVGGEGATCSDKPRTVLLSQGSRGVVEIIGPSEEGIANDLCTEFPVPSECLP